jgi:hypothetical protein
MKKSTLLAVLLVITPMFFCGNSYAQMPTSVGVPMFIHPASDPTSYPVQYDFTGFGTSPYNISGMWYDGSEGWYLKPKADGSGWEAGVINPTGLATGAGHLKMSWTPTGGWVIDQGPVGSFLSFGPWDGEVWPVATSEQLMQDWSVVQNDGTTFSSTNFVEGVVDTNGLAAWDTQFQEFYAAHPEIPNPYEGGGGGSGGAFVNQAEELNKGLEFNNGQWTVKP